MWDGPDCSNLDSMAKAEGAPTLLHEASVVAQSGSVSWCGQDAQERWRTVRAGVTALSTARRVGVSVRRKGETAGKGEAHPGLDSRDLSYVSHAAHFTVSSTASNQREEYDAPYSSTTRVRYSVKPGSTKSWMMPIVGSVPGLTYCARSRCTSLVSPRPVSLRQKLESEDARQLRAAEERGKSQRWRAGQEGRGRNALMSIWSMLRTLMPFCA